MLLDYPHSRRTTNGRRSRLAMIGWLFSFFTMRSCALLFTDLEWEKASFALALTPSVLTLGCCVIAVIRIDHGPIPLKGRELAIFGGAISVLSMLLVAAMKIVMEMRN